MAAVRFPKLAETLTRYKEASGLNGNQLATHIGVEFSAVYRWMRGESQPTGANLRKLIAHTGLRLDALLADERPASVEADASPADDGEAA